MQHDPDIHVTNIQVFGAKTRNKDFMTWLGEVLRWDWIKKRDCKVNNDQHAQMCIAMACNCVDNNDFVSLQEILQKVDISATDYDGSTPVHRACETGNVDMFKYLISKGSSYHLTDLLGNTPMTLAIRNRHVKIVCMLQRLGGTVYLEAVRIGMELCKAVLTRDYVKLEAWYLSGTEMDQGDYNGRTAMHTAVRNRDTTMVAKLLEYGATPLELDVWGWTAVDEAKKHHLTDILMLFHPLFTEKFTDKHLYQLYRDSLEDGLE